jgi:hypothetical protein
MARTTLTCYSPSGFMRPSTVPFFLSGAVVGVLAAWLYQLLMDWIPFIYLNLLLCAGFGAALGVAGAWAVKAGHCRNRAVALLCALLLAAAPLAASYYWGYRSTVREIVKQHPEVSPAEVSHEYTVARWVSDKQEVGWKIKGSSVTGWGVRAVWAAEALVVFGVVLMIVWGAVSAPYCERCNRFCDPRALTLGGVSRKEADPLLGSGDLDAMIALAPPTAPDGAVGLVFTATVCGGCAETGFLTVVERVTTIKRGKREEKRTTLISHAVLRADQRARLLGRIEPLPAPAASAGAASS